MRSQSPKSFFHISILSLYLVCAVFVLTVFHPLVSVSPKSKYLNVLTNLTNIVNDSLISPQFHMILNAKDSNSNVVNIKVNNNVDIHALNKKTYELLQKKTIKGISIISNVRNVSDAPIPVNNNMKFNGVSKSFNFKISESCSKIMSDIRIHKEHWEKARRELGFTLKSDAKRYEQAIRLFYSESFGLLTVCIDKNPVSYVILWKSGNDAIRLNLIDEEKKKPVPFTFKTRESHSKSQYVSKLKSQFRRSQFPEAFTFVREPISHFISGLSEYYYRNYGTTKIDKKKLLQDLQGMLDGTSMSQRADKGTKSRQNVYVIRHFMAMSGILRVPYNLQHVGLLENFDHDWKAINSLYRMNINFNRSLGYHPTSKDPNNIRAIFRELFAESPVYKRALCHILYTDYVCFPFYDIPVECKDIFLDYSTALVGSYDV